MTEQQVREILNKYYAGQASDEEKALLFKLIDQLGADRMPGFSEKEMSRFIEEMDTKMADASGLQSFQIPKSSAKITRWLAAASIIIILLSGAYYFLFTDKKSQSLAANAIINDIEPGHDGAILQLADGRKIIIDSAAHGLIAQQNGTQISLNENGLSYNTASATEGAINYNTLQTPKGRQFHIKLPDGTEAWLNASSSLKYPTVFKDKQRVVQVTGEVYFEIAPDKQKPFIAETEKGTKIEVLGTHFNVNAYNNEVNVKTTLLQGRVKVYYGNKSVIINPGDQVQTDADALVTKADTEEATAWKDGYFYFNDADLPTVLRQLVRWYDVEIKYEGQIPKANFVGQIPRKSTLSQVLKVLSNSGVKFNIDNKTIIIQP
jgi:transmembrane sensor